MGMEDIRKTPSLKALAKFHLDKTIQEGEHDSVVDARVPVEIYLKYRDMWEKDKEGNFLFVEQIIQNRILPT
jgi:hypothetical protein